MRETLCLRLLIALAMMALLAGCQKPAPQQITTERKLPGEPIIRVRIEHDATALKLTSPTKVQLYSRAAPERKQLLSTPLTIKLAAGQWLLNTPTQTALPLDSILVIEPLGPAPLGVSKQLYPGAIRLIPEARDPHNAGNGDHFDVVNHVRLEAYLPGVLDRELYDSWQPATYLAQAIAARSYAISRMMDFGPGRMYDVESTQASQAYVGLARHPICTRAVADTMGLVLTWKGQVLPAYYSSCCGGLGQSNADAFDDATALPPLMPKGPRSWCAGSRYFTWGPVRRKRDMLTRRLAAWGQTYHLSIAKLRKITGISVSETNRLGRPVEFQIIDAGGDVYKLRGETFRHACNFTSDALKITLASGDRLLSSYVQVALDGDSVVFSNAHGFGHGVGLCQFGAQAMAQAGYNPLEILSTYYPGAKIERAY